MSCPRLPTARSVGGVGFTVRAGLQFLPLLCPALHLRGRLPAGTASEPSATRRQLLIGFGAAVGSAGARPATLASAADVTEWQDPRWESLGLKGTAVPLRTVEAAAKADSIGQMGLYPDPLLRRVGSPVLRSETTGAFDAAVGKVADMLIAEMKSNAITALQYGVDARIIVLRGPASPRATPTVFVNPTILSRSAEERMVPWREICLVLPPGLQVDLLRDEVVEVRAQDVSGVPFATTLRGEAARAFQHELDHLDGILIVDHAGLDELPSGVQALERPFHAERQRRAFERRVYTGFLEQQPWAKEAVKTVCGGVPSRVPRGCNGSQKNAHGLLDHAKNKSHASVDEDDDDSDEYYAKELHKKFYDYMDRTISLQEQLRQKERQLHGQAAENSSRKRKMAMNHQQEMSSLVQKHEAALDEQAKRHQQDMKKAREEGAKRLEAIEREFGEVVMDEAARSSEQALKLEQQLEKMQADNRQLSRELKLTKDGLKRQEEKRKAEIERIAQELQSTHQELERENLERLQAEDKQKNEAARQRIQQMEEQLKKAEQEKAKLHEQMEEEAQHYGALTGQEHMYKEAQATVFDAIKHRFANDPRVPWREFGELDWKTLRDRGLKGDDFQVATITDLWQNGFWNENPKEDHDVSTYGPPFIAKWAFKRVSNEPVAYEIREKDEEIHYERQMPMGLPARRETITYSAAFVQHMRWKYRGKADALLKYLLDKYVEYQSHSSGLGYSGYSVIRKIWNEGEDREMTLLEMCKLLVSLTG